MSGQSYVDASGRHYYTSTACMHNKCSRCRDTCKYCGDHCKCSCHYDESLVLVKGNLGESPR